MGKGFPASLSVRDPVNAGVLYIVPTPLGNLGDITLRSIEVLKTVEVIACEDTRRTLKLLNHLGISKTLWSYHAYSSDARVRQLLTACEEGKAIALVCDAGTPGLSDPGAELIRHAVAVRIPVVSLPGPCAAITALAASGLPMDRFFFIGFLPRRPARAKRVLAQAVAAGSTVILYESPFRVVQTLEWIEEAAGAGASVVLARELTKVYEEFLRGTTTELREQLKGNPVKGEVTILFNARKDT